MLSLCFTQGHYDASNKHVRLLMNILVPWNRKEVDYMSRIIIGSPEALRGSSVEVCRFVCLQSRTDSEKEPKGHSLDDKRRWISITRSSDVLVLHVQDMQHVSEELVTARLQKIMSAEGMWAGGQQSPIGFTGRIVDAILHKEPTDINHFWDMNVAYNVWRGLPSYFPQSLRLRERNLVFNACLILKVGQTYGEHWAGACRGPLHKCPCSIIRDEIQQKLSRLYLTSS